MSIYILFMYFDCISVKDMSSTVVVQVVQQPKHAVHTVL